VQPVIDAANAFADAMQEAEQFLSPEAVAALAAGHDESYKRPSARH
jgi:hypothetical protein